MDSFENVKRRIRNKKAHNNIPKSKEPTNKYVNHLIARLLVSIIIFLVVVILMNTNKTANKFISKEVLTDNISFSRISNLYNKYFGNILPFKNVVDDDKTVFNEKMKYEAIDSYKDGFVLSTTKNYLVPVINSGIIVFIGEKEGLGNTIIVQGIDEIDYWYSNIENTSISLYDYVEAGSLLGTVKGDKLYMTFKKGNEFLDYDEVVK